MHTYAAIDADGYVITSWTDTRDAGHPDVRLEGDRISAQCGGSWVYVDGQCCVGDRLDVDVDGCATTEGVGGKP
jgi:hypothetical protein